MFSHTTTVDQSGRITLPQPVLAALGVRASRKIKIIIELTETGVVIKSEHLATPITDRIAAMELPVADWEQMEQEIQAGRLE